MKKFAIMFAAVCLMTFAASESHAQCARGGGFYGGGYGRGVSVNVGTFRGVPAYRPSVGLNYGYARPVYRNYGYGYGYGRPYGGNYGGGFYGGGYRPGCGGRGVSIRF